MRIVWVVALVSCTVFAAPPDAPADAPPEIRAIFEKMHSGKPPTIDEQTALRNWMGARARGETPRNGVPAGTLGTMPADIQELLSKQRRGETLTPEDIAKIRRFGEQTDANKDAILSDLERKKRELEAARPTGNTQRSKILGPLKGELVITLTQSMTTRSGRDSGDSSTSGGITVPVEFRISTLAKPFEFLRTVPDEAFMLEALTKGSTGATGSVTNHTSGHAESITTDSTNSFIARDALMVTSKMTIDPKKKRPSWVITAAITGKSTISGTTTTSDGTHSLSGSSDKAGAPWQGLTIDSLDTSAAAPGLAAYGVDVASMLPAYIKKAIDDATVSMPLEALKKGLASGGRFEFVASSTWQLNETQGEGTALTKTKLDVTYRFLNEAPELDLFVDFKEDLDSWLPKADLESVTTPGNALHVTARLGAKDSGYLPAPMKIRTLTFELTDTSKIDGRCLNVPIPPTSDPSDLDFKFAANNGNPHELVAPGKQRLVVTPDQDSGLATIESFDFGGFSVLTVTAELADGRTLKGHRANHAETEITLPDREPGKHIAKAWLKDKNVSSEDEDVEKPKWTINTHPGDGLSAYEEYRGVRMKDGHRRLDPAKQELFIENFMAEKPRGGFAKFSGLTDVVIVELSSGQLGPERIVNANGAEHRLGRQHALRIRSKTLDGDTCGEEPQLTSGLPSSPKDAVVLWLKVDAPGDISTCVAHEIGHGVGMLHHGLSETQFDGEVNHLLAGGSIEWRKFDRSLLYTTCVGAGCKPARSDAAVKWFDATGREVPPVYTIEQLRTYPVGVPNGPGSGDLDCLMSYGDFYQARFNPTGSTAILYLTPEQPPPTKICTSVAGTHYNEKYPTLYFGEASGRLAPCAAHLRIKSY